MADEFFNPDPEKMSEFREHTERTQEAMGRTKDYAIELDSIISTIIKAYEEIEKSGTSLGIDPMVLAQVQSIHKTFLGTAVALRAVVGQQKQMEVQTKKIEKVSKEDEKRKKKEVAVVRELQKLTKLLTADIEKKNKAEIAAAEKLAAKKKEDADKAKKEKQGYIGKQVSEVSGQLTAMAGLGGIIKENKKSMIGFELSIAGVIKLLLRMANTGNIIRGYSKQAGYQFQEWGTGLGTAKKAAEEAKKSIGDLRGRFLMDYEAAGQLTSQLAQAGMEAEDMGTGITKAERAAEKVSLAAKGIGTNAAKVGKDFESTGSRMMAVQMAQGRSVDTQLESVMNLRNNFGLMVTSAQTLDALLGDIGKKIPGLSPQQAVTDIQAMGRGMRIFSTDLLDSITLFHSLNNAAEEHRKLVKEAQAEAKKLGTQYQAPKVKSAWGTMATAPLEQRQALLQWMSSAPMLISTGMKVALGKGGTTAGERGWEFQQAMSKEEGGKGIGSKEGGKGTGEFFKRAIEYVRDSTQQFAGPGKELYRQEAVMGLLQNQLGMQDKELAMRTAQGIIKGDFDPKQMEKLMADLQKERKDAEAKVKGKDDLMDKLLATGQGINTNLTSLEKRLEKWVTDTLLGPLTRLTDALRALADKMPSIDQAKDNLKLMTGGAREEAEERFKEFRKKVGVGGARPLNAMASFMEEQADESATAQQEVTPGGFLPGFHRAFEQEQLTEGYGAISDPTKLLTMLQTPAAQNFLQRNKVTDLEIRALTSSLQAMISAQSSGGKRSATAATAVKNAATAQKAEKSIVKPGGTIIHPSEQDAPLAVKPLIPVR